jgi:hypothetical protein
VTATARMHRWGVKVRLDGELADVKRLDELGSRWVETGTLLEIDMQVIKPTLDDPYYTFIVEAFTERAACETVAQAVALLQGDDHAV